MFPTRYAIITEGDHQKLLAVADWLDINLAPGCAKALWDIAARSVELDDPARFSQERLPDTAKEGA